jgi:hypothetical protein
MKQVIFILVAVLCFGVSSCSAQNTSSRASTVLGVFVASTPCSEGTRPLPGISVRADCEFIIWNLTLYQNPGTFAPTTYKLAYSYGLSQPGTPGFIGGGTKVEMKGTWSMIKGAGSDGGRIVYRLLTDMPNTTISFLKLNDYLLHLLDNDKRLMIGSASYSYTLNRIKDKL